MDPKPDGFSAHSILERVLPDYTQQLSTSIPAPASRTFACFADLTTEIRLDIWELTFPAKRRIAVQPHKLKKAPRMFRCTCEPLRCAHPPVALFINRESRAEALRHYRCFTRDVKLGGKRRAGQRIYYRPGHDVLYVGIGELPREGWGQFETGVLVRIEGQLVRVPAPSRPYDWAQTACRFNGDALRHVTRFEIRFPDLYSQDRIALERREVGLLDKLPNLQVLDVVLEEPWDLAYAAVLLDPVLNRLGVRAESQERFEGDQQSRGLNKARELHGILERYFEWVVATNADRRMPRINMTWLATVPNVWPERVAGFLLHLQDAKIEMTSLGQSRAGTH